MNSSLASLPPVRAHGKFLRHGADKFLLKAMRLPEVGAVLDLSGKVALRKRLEELADANVNALILTEAQAETVLSLASQVGLYAMVEIAIDGNDFAKPARRAAATTRIAHVLSGLRGHPALCGFLIDLLIDVDSNATPPGVTPSPEIAQSALGAVIHTMRAIDSRLLIALKRRVEQSVLPPLAVPLSEEDLTFASLDKIDPRQVNSIVCALHDIAGTRPLIIEIGEGLPGQDEVLARAFGNGVAGVVAPARRRAVSSERHNIRMLSAGELLPFAHLEGSSVPLPMSTPMVSVVVAARDDERTIAACLDSVGRLQYPNFEVIVIDDASSDRSLEIASNIPGVRLLRQPSPAGFRSLLNAAVRAARGPLVAFTRADCVVDSDWLTLAVRALTEARHDAVSGPVLRSPEETRRVITRVRSSIGRVGGRRSSRNLLPQLDVRNMLIRKSSLIAVRGLRARLVHDRDGRDLATRMLAANMSLGWCPAGVVWRSGHRTLGQLLHQRIHDGRFAAGLAIASLGGIAQALARHAHPLASGRAAIVPPAPSGEPIGSTRTHAIGSHRPPAPYPSGR